MVSLQVSAFPLAAMFGMCGLFMIAALFCQRKLEGLVHDVDRDSFTIVDSNSEALRDGARKAHTAKNLDHL